MAPNLTPSDRFQALLLELAENKHKQAELALQEDELLAIMRPNLLMLAGHAPAVLPFEKLDLVIKVENKDKRSFDQPFIEAVLGPDLFDQCKVFNSQKFEEVLLKNPQHAAALVGAVKLPLNDPARLETKASIPKAKGRKPARAAKAPAGASAPDPEDSLPVQQNLLGEAA